MGKKEQSKCYRRQGLSLLVLLMLVGGFLLLTKSAEAVYPSDASPKQSASTPLEETLAVWADSESGSATLDVSGSSNLFRGVSHSNSGVRVSGSSNTFAARVEYVTALNVSGGGNQFQEGTEQVASAPQPISFNVADYAPGGIRAQEAQSQGRYYQRTGTYTFSAGDVALGGLWYVSGNAKLSGSGMSSPPWGITIVSTGQVEASGSNLNLTPFEDNNLLLFSDKTGSASNAVLKVSGSSHSWRGHLYAPNGLVQMSGSSNTIEGIVLGEWVRLSGSRLTIVGAEVGPPPCPIVFTDVPRTNAFYPYVMCLACRGIVGGYECGQLPGEPCDAQNNPYFRWGSNVTRGQIAKMVSESAGFSEDPGPQKFEDVPPGDAFYETVNRLTNRGYIGGYSCGQLPTEPCVAPDNRPYFRSHATATRGQLSKIVSNAAGFAEDPGPQYYEDVAPNSPFYVWINRLTYRGIAGGYPCGQLPSEPCVPPDNRPYFRWANNVTRGQATKFIALTFFPDCEVD
jgi:hypothetical protein